jgi:GTPase SAR1 family protein
MEKVEKEIFPDHEIRLLLTGDEKVGKTSMIDRF